jgi:hypothetical protein
MFSFASVANGESRDLSIERECANAVRRCATEQPTPTEREHEGNNRG